MIAELAACDFFQYMDSGATQVGTTTTLQKTTKLGHTDQEFALGGRIIIYHHKGREREREINKASLPPC